MGKPMAKLIDNGTLNRDLNRRVTKFTQEVQVARTSAAKTATTESRRAYKRLRPLAPGRPGRNRKTAMTSHVKWQKTAGAAHKSVAGARGPSDGVALRVADLDANAPYWIIQEIGTGRSASLKSPGGRATKIRVKRQRGRRISPGLVWATGPRGSYVPPITGRVGQHQLFLRKQVKGVPWTRTRSQAAIRIKREIKGQHFVQAGGEQGFREYRESILAAARQQFHRPKR